MKEKLMSRKFWVTILSAVISITMIFSDMGGLIGTIAGIIGVVATSIFYMISESNIDIARIELEKEKIKTLVEQSKKEGGDK